MHTVTFVLVHIGGIVTVTQVVPAFFLSLEGRVRVGVRVRLGVRVRVWVGVRVRVNWG